MLQVLQTKGDFFRFEVDKYFWFWKFEFENFVIEFGLNIDNLNWFDIVVGYIILSKFNKKTSG